MTDRRKGKNNMSPDPCRGGRHNFHMLMILGQGQGLHLPTFRSKAATVSKKSTVFTFSYREASVTKFDLALK